MATVAPMMTMVMARVRATAQEITGTERDERRRSYGQNFLVDRPLIDRFVAGLDLGPDDLVVDLGAGTGALTRPLAATGAAVWAVESDPVWARRLRTTPDRTAPRIVSG